jgi:hypothetical protein
MKTSPLLLSVAALAASASCTIGAPPGFSDGSSWSFPLVGSLEGGQVLAPVMIHDKGPYLFVIDPDAPVSVLDSAIANELELRSGVGPQLLDESDTQRTTMTAEVLKVSVGTLTVKSRVFLISDVGAYNTAGRQVRGVIGRDILADSLVYGFDRDRAMGYLATQKGFTAPTDAVVVSYELRKNRVPTGMKIVSRRLVDAKVNGKTFTLHVDLGEVPSQLREKKWGEAAVAPIAVQRTMTDEAGTHRDVTKGAIASLVELGAAQARDVLFVPYGDKRWDEIDFDGTLGLGFFSDYVVWNNFDDNAIYLAPRTKTDLTTERIARWGSDMLDSCAVPACTTAALLAPPEEPPPAPPADPTDPAAGAPAEPAVMKPAPVMPAILEVTRTESVADVALEVLLEARAQNGEPAGLPLVVATFPVGTTHVTQRLDDAYRDTTWKVIDASPFVRACPKEGACIYQLGAAK